MRVPAARPASISTSESPTTRIARGEAGEAQHRRKRPELGNREWPVLLIGFDELHGTREADLHTRDAEPAMRQGHDPRVGLSGPPAQPRR